MAITQAYTQSETVSGTEWSLTTDTAGPDATVDTGIFQAFIDLSALAAGDVYEFRCYEKVISGGTQRLVFTAAFAGVQAMPIWTCPTLVLMHGWDMTLIKISGTDRSITWSIRKVG